MGLTLQNNGGDDLTVMADGSFVFPTNVRSGQGYDVTVSAQPVSPWQTCTVAAGTGGVAGVDITNVAITCTTNAYQVGGTVSGLASSVTLHNGGGHGGGQLERAVRVPDGRAERRRVRRVGDGAAEQPDPDLHGQLRRRQRRRRGRHHGRRRVRHQHLRGGRPRQRRLGDSG